MKKGIQSTIEKTSSEAGLFRSTDYNVIKDYSAVAKRVIKLCDYHKINTDTFLKNVLSYIEFLRK